jgi:protein-disulfide isomerase
MLPNQPDLTDQPQGHARGNIRRRKWSLLAAGLVVAIALVFIVMRMVPALRPSEGPRPNPQIGPKDAPVTIVEFGDYGCSACRVWAQAGMRQQLLDKYGDKVRFVWADFPVVTLESAKAAEAGRCAEDQGKFWEYQDYLYNHYEGIGIVSLKFYAGSIGLDQAQFEQCLSSGARKGEVTLDFQDAMNRFLDATPTFLINDKVGIIGMASLDKFSAVIDPILAGTH